MSNKIDKAAFKGIFVPILTPVDDSGAIDERRLRAQTDYVIEHGVDGILAFGSNSEFYMFEDDEMIEATRWIIDQAAGRVPVMFGIGHIRTSRASALARRASDLDIDAISVLQPMFIVPTAEALYHHFSAIAHAVPDTAMFIYNNPGRAGYAVPIPVITRLAHEIDSIVGIKDSSGNITDLQELIRQNRDIGFRVFAGKDTIVYLSLSAGAAGSVCSTANMYPELVCGIYDKFVAGDLSGALEDQFTLNPIRLSQDAASFPAATKDMARLMGMDVGSVIPPTEATTGPALEHMKRTMREAGYLK
ncbi:dihydrodipicolinate synthetase [Coriobacterium glomerans PW2]|uniref:Dihydrodipicolinate synthetase n=1 Tax=Coriobacterium glomerans (strain ATCC 49209 / DSM 20642 / JCM 10262 / PW2) TaxID=700015 RepID=F2N8R2_CORGP|nr:dihydrodipicolinate synthase family protein [Coriobacterium glomerans]AEB07445.1 dihydrodipicolinate synthetase [Coriobacterium glomerans PW2]